MSLQTILEGDDQKGRIIVNEVVVRDLDTLLLSSVGNITDEFNAGPAGPAANVNLLVTITKNLALGEVYLLLYQVTAAGTVKDIEYNMDVFFEKGGGAGVELIIAKTVTQATSIGNGSSLSGFNILTITAGREGVGKVIQFDAVPDTTEILLKDARVVLIRIA